MEEQKIYIDVTIVTSIVLPALMAIVLYMLKTFTLDPLSQYVKAKHKIQNKLRYHKGHNTSNVDSDLDKERQTTIRELSCELEEKYGVIFGKRLLVRLGALPKKDNIKTASGNLIRISNSVNDQKISGSCQEKLYKEIGDILRIDV